MKDRQLMQLERLAELFDEDRGANTPRQEPPRRLSEQRTAFLVCS
jgi:hypothetical protein